MSALDIAANRSATKYTASEQLGRTLWSFAAPLFRFSPRVLFAWRRVVLRSFRAQIGRHVNIYNSAQITIPWNLTIGDWSAVGEGALLYNLGRLTIGERVTISQRAHLCGGTHDYNDPAMPLIRSEITIEDNAWICADAFIGPGVTVGEGAVCGARAVVVKDVEPWTVVAGNPARVVGKVNGRKVDGASFLRLLGRNNR